MKKIISILICTLIVMSAMTIIASAAGPNNTYTYEINEIKYTVEFEDTSIPTEKQTTVAQKLVGIDNDSAQTYGLGCTLFGHDLKTTSASVTEHKVRTYAPRCLRRTYDVTYCEDCDYTEQTLVASSYIICCPED